MNEITLTVVPRHKSPDYGWIRSAGECTTIQGCHLEYEEHRGSSDGFLFHIHEDDDTLTCVVTPDGTKFFGCKKAAEDNWITSVDYCVREGDTHR